MATTGKKILPVTISARPLEMDLLEARQILDWIYQRTMIDVVAVKTTPAEAILTPELSYAVADNPFNHNHSRYHLWKSVANQKCEEIALKVHARFCFPPLSLRCRHTKQQLVDRNELKRMKCNSH